MKQLILLLSLMSILVPSVEQSYASSRIDQVLKSDREARIEEINRITILINESQLDLANFQYELTRITSDKSVYKHKVFMRNVAGVVAAIGFCTTLIYQKQRIIPTLYRLVGGYTLAGISTIVMAIEHQGVRLSQKEIDDLKKSIIKLEVLIQVEKKNLAREIEILNS